MNSNARFVLSLVMALNLMGPSRSIGFAAEPVTKKINLLDLIKSGSVDYHINEKSDVHDDPKDIWTFQADGSLHVSGRGYGYVATRESYRDYHLVLEFKWGQKTWGSRAKSARDNGILLHAHGPHGAYGGTWMASIECQIIEGGVGDILVLSPKLADGTELRTSVSAEIALDRDKEMVWKKGEPRQTVTSGRINWRGRDVDWKDTIGFRGIDEVELPLGEWNRLEVIAKGDTLQYVLNGSIVNEAFDCKPSEGKILLQTEAAEMMVRRYELYPLGQYAEPAQPSPDLAPALTFHASFDHQLDADFSKGDKDCTVKQGKISVPAILNDEVKLVTEGGRFGGALHFTKKGNTRPQFNGNGVLGYNDKNWGASVSAWLKLDPDKDLEPGYCDPVQIVGDDVKKGFIFLEWSKDESPRHFRFAIRPLLQLWNPNNVDWAKLTPAQRPAVNLERAPFSREAWTHVVFSFENLNDKAKKPVGRLYLNGELKGTIENWDLTLGWDPAQVFLVLGASYVGYIDDLAVFNRRLTDDEVKTIHSLKNGIRDLRPTVRPAVVRSADYPTLQDALDAIPATGGELRLAPGTIEIDKPLRLHRGDVRIIGAGPSTHIVNKNQAGEPAWLVAPSPGDLQRDPKSSLWRVQFQDLRITGNPKSGHGIEARKVNELFLHGITVSYHGGDGVAMIECTEDPRIVACLFTYNKRRGVLLDNCHDIVVSANHFEENEDGLHCTNSFNLCMNGNNLDDHLRHGVTIENTYGSVLSGNMIEECNGTAIILDRDCYGITLSANVIAHHLQGGIDLKDAWGCAISANTFVLVHEYGVRAGGSSGRLTITGNSFCNSEIGIGGMLKRPSESPQPMSRDAGSGIVLDATRDILISGNQFSGLGTPAVLTSNACERVLLQGNLATDCGRRSKERKTPWFDLRASKDSEATGNLPRSEVSQ